MANLPNTIQELDSALSIMQSKGATKEEMRTIYDDFQRRNSVKTPQVEPVKTPPVTTPSAVPIGPTQSPQDKFNEDLGKELHPFTQNFGETASSALKGLGRGITSFIQGAGNAVDKTTHAIGEAGNDALAGVTAGAADLLGFDNAAEKIRQNKQASDDFMQTVTDKGIQGRKDFVDLNITPHLQDTSEHIVPRLLGKITEFAGEEAVPVFMSGLLGKLAGAGIIKLGPKAAELLGGNGGKILESIFTNPVTKGVAEGTAAAYGYEAPKGKLPSPTEVALGIAGGAALEGIPAMAGPAADSLAAARKEKGAQASLELLNPPAGKNSRLTRAQLQDSVLPEVDTVAQTIKKAPTYKAAKDQISMLKDKIFSARNEILAADNFKVGESYLDDLGNYIDQVRKEGIRSPSEIVKMEEILKREQTFLQNTPNFDRVSAQARKELFQKETQTLLKKKAMGTITGAESAEITAQDKIRAGLRKAVENGDELVAKMNGSYDGLSEAEKLLATQAAKSLKAPSPSLLAKATNLITGTLLRNTGFSGLADTISGILKVPKSVAALTKAIQAARTPGTFEKILNAIRVSAPEEAALIQESIKNENYGTARQQILRLSAGEDILALPSGEGKTFYSSSAIPLPEKMGNQGYGPIGSPPGTSRSFKSGEIPQTKDFQPLAAEARKYRSAEEFVKSQSLYHGTPNELEGGALKFGAGSQLKKGGYMGGHFLTDTPEIADNFSFGGKVYQASGEIKNKVLDINKSKNLFRDFVGKKYKTSDGELVEFTKQEFDYMFPSGKADWSTINTDLAEKIAKRQGKIGIAIPEYVGGREGITYQIFKDNIPVKTKQELIDIWEKANGK